MDNQPHDGRQRRWELTGAGLNNLDLVEREIPRPSADELLVRIDACGVCFSDIKILNLGPNHPRLQGRDLSVDPVVMGHETAMTVLEVGSKWADRFRPGQRFLIQADVYYQGEGMAFGYRLPGGYSQYQLITHPILEGDEGCYLLPVSEGVSHAQAALCEPWACVEASYRYQPRMQPRQGGDSVVFLLDTELVGDIAAEVRAAGNARVLTPAETPWIRDPARAAEGVEALLSDQPAGFDDVFLFGMPNPELAREATRLLKNGGVYAIQGEGSTGPLPVDVGSVHYRDHWYTGSPAGNVLAWGRTTELSPGGVAWFIGAGGPLGQMHIQRALALPHPPSKIIISQRGGPRLEELRRRFAATASERGVELVLLDAGELGEGVYAAVREASGGRGCDDVVVIIPNAEVVARAFEALAPGGGLNIFAGVAVGTTADIDLGRVASDGVRLWGTSGSKISDLQSIVDKMETGGLPTDRVVAAVGGIEAVKQGLEAVRDGVFLGKTLIYPHCKNLPLITVADLAEKHPSIKERMLEGHYWTPEAEAELLRLYRAAD